ncbi:FxSxx-COOH system tetratricopeptide repeat protein [Streptomyces agglomeratus]|uniref:FxSxx-COOH system tetratricopeptide repeat protein n=1 Tax=Streptomyces agglomeratus TaxID=285458 RepID=UPI00099FF4AB|nr:FxSxx-COOH system tetratricopeptide repeat protein [Streptomyces agglomeratus]
MNTAATRQPGEIVTFYSYKGGTGRTMALANVAWILASNGKSVLVVDWDLEAPGLHRYFHPFLLDKELRTTPGILEMLWDFTYASLDKSSRHDPGWHEAHADPLQHAVSLRWNFPAGGHIDFLSAGRQDKTFGQRVNSFDWHAFYNRFGGSEFIDSMRRQMAASYDYVLIDSRTGLSDTSGICTIQMPDTLIACFTMSTQSISGCAGVAESVQIRSRRPMRILPVPMRVESGETDRLEESRDWVQWRFRDTLTLPRDATLEKYWGDVEVPYRSLYAYEELLATVGDRPGQEDTLLAAFERLTNYLTEGKVIKARPMEPAQRATLRNSYRERPSGRLKYDFYLSYALNDKAWAEWIADQLVEAGYQVAPTTSLSPGAPMAYAMRSAVESSAKILLLLSPDMEDVKWASTETHLDAVVAQRSNMQRVIAVKVSKFPSQVAAGISKLHMLDISGLTEADARARLLGAAIGSRPSLGGAAPTAPSKSNSPYPDEVPEIWELPDKIDPFVGREAELLRLLRHFQSDATPFVISGMPGVGKTALAIEFAHRARGRYKAATLIQPSGATGESHEARALGAAAELMGERWLPDASIEQGGRRALVIFDGFENVVVGDDFAESLPGCDVIITGRREPTGSRYGIHLEVFSSAESHELLKKFVPDIQRQAVDRISLGLGGHPLAVRIAANQLSVSGASIPDFVTLLENRLDQVVLRASGDSGKYLISKFQELFARLEVKHPETGVLLQLLALASPHPIPTRMLVQAHRVLPAPLDAAAEHLDHTVRLLLSENLAEEDSGALHTHPVVAAAIRTSLSSAQHQKLSQHLARMLVANDPGDPSDPEHWPIYRSLMPLTNTVQWPADTGFRELLLRLCWYQLSSGHPLTAKDLAERVATQFERMLGSVHADTLASLHVVALCDWELGNARQAEAMLIQVNDARTELLGPADPATMASRNNLAAAFAGQGKWAESVALHRQILQDRHRSLGPDHPDTLVSEGNLASSLYGAGDYEQANKIETEVWRKRVKRYGETHPASLASADNLASIWEMLGEHEKALQLRKVTWDGRMMTMGPQHPETLRCAAALVFALSKHAAHDEARSVAAAINDSMYKVFGPENALTRQVAAVAVGPHRDQHSERSRLMNSGGE